MNLFWWLTKKSNVSKQLKDLQETTLQREMLKAESKAKEIHLDVIRLITDYPAQNIKSWVYVHHDRHIAPFGFTEIEQEKTVRDLRKLGFKVREVDVGSCYRKFEVSW